VCKQPERRFPSQWRILSPEITLFDAQDDIDRRREQLIAEIEGKLQQRVS